jgi:asparagine synthase (glutamine-hydrolysing)
MTPRYLILAGPGEEVAAFGARAADFAVQHDLALAYSAAGLAVLAAPGAIRPFARDALVLGSLFARRDARPGGREPAERNQIDRHRGSYLAIVRDTESRAVRLLRAPFGELGCYYCAEGAFTLAASDVELLCAWTGRTPPIDWQAVGRHLLASELRGPETCLSGIRELLGGTRLTIAPDGLACDSWWSPWSFVAPGRADVDISAAGLRAVVVECVGQVGRCFDRVLLGLSGGLDSSIVAAALATAGVRFECLTLVTADALGDERMFARAVAETLGVRLIEAPRLLTGVDVMRSGAAHLPRPVARAFAQESDRNLIAAARGAGTGAILRGGGGDNVFCYLRSVRPSVDRLRSQGLFAAFETLADVARLTGCGLPTAFRSTLRRLVRSPAYRLAADPTLLAPEIAADAPEAECHPWLETPPGALPGKAAHIGLLLAMSNHMEPLAPEIGLPLLSPLMSQPIVEYCLGVPSWLWCRGGHNRMVARRAFADRLPPDVLARRGKGTPEPFAIEIFEANRAALCEMLEDGLLAAHGLIDLAAVRAVLAEAGPVRSKAHARVMQLADVEAWARSWSGRQSVG